MREDQCMPAPNLQLTGNKAADKLLASNPLALLIAMVLDQQIPLEWAFRGPYELKRRLKGPLNATYIAEVDPDEFISIFSAKPALHRYPGSMAARVQALCRTIVEDYGSKPASIWMQAADGKDLMKRVRGLPGFGEMKAKIFIALLGKQFALEVPGWRDVCAPYGEPGSFRSVADIVDPASLEKVRATKAQAKAAAKKK